MSTSLLWVWIQSYFWQLKGIYPTYRITLQWRILANTALTKGSRLTGPLINHRNISIGWVMALSDIQVMTPGTCDYVIWQKGLCRFSWDGEIILDYLGGLSVIMRVYKSEAKKICLWKKGGYCDDISIDWSDMATSQGIVGAFRAFRRNQTCKTYFRRSSFGIVKEYISVVLSK